MRAKDGERFEWTPLRIVLVYAVFSIMYILISDWAVTALVNDDATRMLVSMVKGWGFIIITAILLYLLILRGHVSAHRSMESLRQSEAKVSLVTQEKREMHIRSIALETRLQGLLNRLDVGVFQLDAKGKIMSGNPAFFRIIEAPSRESSVGTDLFSMIEPKGTSDSVRAEVFATARISESEVEVRTLQGNLIVASVGGGIVRTETGEELIEGIIEDISDRKRVESDLALANETMEAIIESSPVAIAVVDSEGKVQTWNSGAERLFEWPRSEIIGRTLPMTGEEREIYDGIFQAMELGEKVVDLETEANRRDGSKVNISISAAPLHDAQGDLAGAVGVMMDITGRKTVEEERRRAYEQIGRNIEQFAILVDSIRNPLTVIVGVADMSEGEKMSLIAEQAERIESIIKQLDAGWIESEKVRQLLKKAD